MPRRHILPFLHFFTRHRGPGKKKEKGPFTFRNIILIKFSNFSKARGVCISNQLRKFWINYRFFGEFEQTIIFGNSLLALIFTESSKKFGEFLNFLGFSRKKDFKNYE